MKLLSNWNVTNTISKPIKFEFGFPFGYFLKVFVEALLRTEEVMSGLCACSMTFFTGIGFVEVDINGDRIQSNRRSVTLVTMN
jgi:hypothetical protein